MDSFLVLKDTIKIYLFILTEEVEGKDGQVNWLGTQSSFTAPKLLKQPLSTMILGYCWAYNCIVIVIIRISY